MVDLADRLRRTPRASRSRRDGLRRAATRHKRFRRSQRHRQREFSFPAKSAACAVNQSKVRVAEFFEDSGFEVGAFAEDWFELEATFFRDLGVLEATGADGVFFWSAISID